MGKNRQRKFKYILKMLDSALLNTIKYFDVQDHCLTLIEISRYLLHADDNGIGISNFTAHEILKCLGSMPEVSSKKGFYFLSGRDSLVDRRLKNNFYASLRFKRAKKFLPFMRYLPFIKAVALSGSEAISNSREDSDIDLLILANTNRIWLARLCATLYFQILGMRRHGKFISNRFCLNHYAQHGKRLDNYRNLYTAVEYVSLIPFFGGKAILEFQQNNLDWINEYLCQPFFASYETIEASVFKKILDFIFSGWFGDILENLCKFLQLKKIKIQEGILILEDELSFHPGRKDWQVLRKFQG